MAKNGSDRVGGEALWVESLCAAREVASSIRGSDRVAVDTEANGFHAYRPRLCLLQLAWESGRGVEVALVDPLVRDRVLEELRIPLEDPELEILMHGADYDVRLLKRDAGIGVRGLFDTQLAARLLGVKRTSLAALAESVCGIQLDKGAQKIDWAARPLPERALRYAVEDVRVLFAVRDYLGDKLAALGREAWVVQESSVIEEAEPPAEIRSDDDSTLSRLSGAGRLDARQRAVLLALARWRDEEARRRDTPPGFVVPGRELVSIARSCPEGEAGLEAAGLARRIVQRYGGALLDAVRRGRRAPPLPAPRPERPPELDEESKTRFERLRRQREAVARELGIESGLLCPTAELRIMSRSRSGSERVFENTSLRDWQRHALTRALREAFGE
jgi:ribonuclease D